MKELDRFTMVEATELDGRKISNPRAMSYEDLIEYIKEREYPINIAVYSPTDLRHQVRLYEKDKDGQQKLQGNLLNARGGKMAIEDEIKQMNDVFEICDPDVQHQATAEATRQVAARKLAAQHGNKKAPAAKAKEQESEAQEFSNLFGTQADPQPVA